MGFFSKLMGEDINEENFDTKMNLQGYQDPNEEDDHTKPKPEFILVKPSDKNELPGIADHLLNRKTVILNLELVTQDTRRFIDFLSGVAYALQGQIKKVAAATFLIIPGGLEISGDIFEDLENEFNF